MRCLNDCHNYEMEQFLQPLFKQEIQFYEMRPDGIRIDGVTNEEVLRVLIHRISMLNAKFPCVENSECLTHLQKALEWLEIRTEGRKARGIEGKMEA